MTLRWVSEPGQGMLRGRGTGQRQSDAMPKDRMPKRPRHPQKLGFLVILSVTCPCLFTISPVYLQQLLSMPWLSFAQNLHVTKICSALGSSTAQSIKF